jgi:hypothetical protein
MTPTKPPHPTLKRLFLGLQKELAAKLLSIRGGIEHAGAKGGATELGWKRMLSDYLPDRYKVDKAFVLDSRGGVSDEVDVVVYDKQYSPLLFHQGGALYVPAESVYAVIEVKQELTRRHISYAGKKAASVRRLHRTSTPIVHAGGIYPPKRPLNILAGVVSLDSTWRPPLGAGLVSALSALAEAERIDLGCTLRHGSFAVEYKKSSKPVAQASGHKEALITFLITLLSRLQDLGTVPALDFSAYARVLGRH